MAVTAADLIDLEALSLARRRWRPASPAALARRLIPGYRIVPTIALISDVITDAVTGADRRYVVSTAPRSGKSMLAAVIGPLFALMLDNDASIIVKSYADTLALEHSGQARRLVTDHTDVLGFSVDQSKSAVDRWLVAGHRGGILSGGILSATTGFGVSGNNGLLVVDDPVRGAADADSPAYRRRLLAAFRADLMSRLHPGAGCVVISSRWSADDLIGSLTSDEDGRWTHINVPAISTPGVCDELHRPPGVAVISPLGRDLDGFREIKQAVGSRAWAALYLGAPSTDEGSLIKAEWLDAHRAPAAPGHPLRIVVGVDPADSGAGDKCGIVAASLAGGRVHLIADVSEQLTSDAWANRAVELAITLGASAIVVEGFSARATYARLVQAAVARKSPAHPISVTTWPPKGASRVGDAVARSSGLLAALENGCCCIAGRLPELEVAMVGWQPGQHQPDAVAAALLGYETLAPHTRARFEIAAPLDVRPVDEATAAYYGRSLKSSSGLGRYRERRLKSFGVLYHPLPR